MIDERRWIPGSRTVAVLTNIAGLQVRTVLTGCIDAVMATKAASRDIRMVEYCGQPGAGLVTIVTLVTGNDVTGGLAGGNEVVMTRITAARHRRMIHECHRAPCVRRVTVTADLRALHMLRAFSGCLDGPDCRMTANAVGTRAFELAARMTAFAGDVDVRTVKVEARTEMIEGRLRIHGRGNDYQDDQTQEAQRRTERRQQSQNTSLHRIFLTSRNDSGEWQRAQSLPNSPS